MSPHEWMKAVHEMADEYGYEVALSGSGHVRLTKEGHPMVFTSRTTSDWRAVRNLRAKLRRNEVAA